MGLFSFLKKQNDAPAPRSQERPFADPASVLAGPATRTGLDTEAERQRQREIARATAAKIDEIELEMTSDIFDDDAWGGHRRTPAATAGGGAAPQPAPAGGAPAPDDVPDALATPSSAPAVEEAAILYANGQFADAEHALRASLAATGRTDRQPWWMLFDLYQALEREHDFESVAIDYASHFETSPPPYQPPAAGAAGTAAGAKAFSGTTPTAVLSGRLDARAGAALARVLAPSPSPVVRIEFHAIAQVAPDGCALLLQALQYLRKDDRELVLAGADHLVALLRPMLQIGDRSSSAAPWLLLLELLLLANREKDFEETAMDYCLTFEISPPSFEAPRRAARNLPAAPGVDGDRFLMPAVVAGDPGPLLAAIADHAGRHAALVLDCSRLARIDYMAATALSARLRNLAQRDDGAARRIELRDLNHLAAALLRLLGAGEHARLHAHRY
ncbi:hypothetical protein [uncultured Massilia sp.]|uniref:hypothetical protein n=1 Tax=uncultured Massilia sp. TaxID=169973 RepID=UPI0025ED3B02|nr:hypothetical protein [uncultured Massilia sp.]